jgi:DNA-binding response OmpR family regulator
MKRILIADDDENARALLGTTLSALGYEPEAVESGVEAIVSLNQGFDLVLLDVSMPGMDGFEVVRRIREHPEHGDVPIIMVTGMASREDRLMAAEAGANDFIAKPVDRVELSVRVGSLLRMKEAQDQIKRHRDELELLCAQRTAELRDVLETAAKIVSAIPLGLLVYQWSPPSKLVFVNSNPEAVRVTGLTIEDWRSRDITETWPNAEAQGLTEAFLTSLETGQVFQRGRVSYARGERRALFTVRAFPLTGGALGVSLDDIDGPGALETLQAAPVDRDDAVRNVEDRLRGEIIARRKAEDLLVRSRRLCEVGQIVARVSARFLPILEKVEDSAGLARACAASSRSTELLPFIEEIEGHTRSGLQLSYYLKELTEDSAGPWDPSIEAENPRRTAN